MVSEKNLIAPNKMRERKYLLITSDFRHFIV